MAQTRKPQSLTGLIGEFETLEALLLETEGEITPEIEAWMGEYELAEKVKVDSYAWYLKELDARAAMLKEQEAELARKRKALDNRAAWLKGRMLDYLTARQKDAIEGEIWKLARRVNGGKRPMTLLVTEDLLDDKYVVTTRVPNLAAIREAVEATPDGILLGGFEGVVARLEPAGHHLRIV